MGYEESPNLLAQVPGFDRDRQGAVKHQIRNHSLRCVAPCLFQMHPSACNTRTPTTISLSHPSQPLPLWNVDQHHEIRLRIWCHGIEQHDWPDVECDTTAVRTTLECIEIGIRRRCPGSHQQREPLAQEVPIPLQRAGAEDVERHHLRPRDKEIIDRHPRGDHRSQLSRCGLRKP